VAFLKTIDVSSDLRVLLYSFKPYFWYLIYKNWQ